MAVIPEWVVPPAQQVADFHHMAYRLADITGTNEAAGQLAAADWLLGGTRPAPVTHRDDPVTWALVRAESWVALCDAARAAAPTPEDWRRLGVAPRDAVAGNSEWSYGVWRTLSWLLGVRLDPPFELSRRLADGTIPESEQRYTLPSRPESSEWQAGQAHRRERMWAEAVVHWQHVRDRADATVIR